MGFLELLGKMSGESSVENQEKLLFNHVIGFRGIVEGVGCSTIVQGLANAISTRTKLRVCVVDTSILYPSQYALLCDPFSSDVRLTIKDWFSADVSIPERIIDTRYKRVSLLGCFNRRLTDAFSASDTIRLVDETMDVLKGLFDIIIVDISHEWSQIAMTMPRYCNKIFTVVDPSSRCVNNLMESLNNLAICAVPFHKYTSAIINKSSKSGLLGIDGILKRSKLDPVAVIPFSQKIFENGTMGRSNWAIATPDPTIEQYNQAIDTLLVSLINESPLHTLDLQDIAELEAAASGAPGGRNKARQKFLEERQNPQPVLQPASEQDKMAVREQRHMRNQAYVAMPKADGFFDDEQQVTQMSIEQAFDSGTRVDTTELTRNDDFSVDLFDNGGGSQ